LYTASYGVLDAHFSEIPSGIAPAPTSLFFRPLGRSDGYMNAIFPIFKNQF